MTIEMFAFGILLLTVVAIPWSFFEKRRIERESKERLSVKLKIIELEKMIGDERRRAVSEEHSIRTGDSPISRMFELLNRFEEPPTIFLNGQLLTPTIDYTHAGDGLRFVFNLKPRDIIQVRGTGEALVTILDRSVREGDVVVIQSTGAQDEESSMEQLRAAERALIAEYPVPEPTTRYSRLMRDDEEGS